MGVPSSFFDLMAYLNYSTESEVRQEGTNRITVDIPGVTNANEILEALGKA